ncbi:hypothetical protein QFZ82_001736 [Streptomyces sp. V4I23]|nr:hypothetical protein [Streptomyces sp. V4I23]
MDQGTGRGVRVGLEAEEDVVDGADPGRVVGGVGARGEVAARAEYTDAVPAHGRQVRAAGDEVDVGTGAMERGPDICADGTGADNCDFHGALRSVRRPSEGGL